MWVRLLDRYILKEMVGPFGVGLVVYSFLFLVNLIFQLASLAIQQGLSPWVTTALFFLSLPSLLSYTLPIALLLGIIIAFSRLSSDSEVIALRACGIPLKGLLRAPVILAGIITAVLLIQNFWLIPLSRTLADRLQGRATQTLNLVRLLRPGVFFERIPDTLLYADRVDLETNTYRDIFVYQRPGLGEDLLTLADWAKVVQSRETGLLQFITGDGQTLHFDRRKPGKVDVSTFSKQTLSFELTLDHSMDNRNKGLTMLLPREILARLRVASRFEDPELVKRERYSLRYELHRRIAGAVVALCFALIAVPLGIVNVRGGKGGGFTISLILVLSYWVLLSALSDLAKAGRLLPEVAAWLPNLLVLALAWPLIRHRDAFLQWGGFEWLSRLLPRREPDNDAEVSHEASVRSRDGWLTLLDRYLFKKLVLFLGLIAASILLLDWIIELRGLSEFLRSGDDWRLLGKYLLNQSPAILSLLLPMTVLLTTLVTFGVLERGNEILAMKASGISLYRLSVPALVLALLAGGALWVMGESLVPSASRKAQRTKDRLKNFASRNVASTMDVWIFAPDRKALFHYNHRDLEKNRFQGFSQYTLDSERFRVRSRFFAKRVKFLDDSEITFKRGWEWTQSEEGGTTFRDLEDGKMELSLSEDYFAMPPLREGQYFSSRELKELITNLRQKGYPTYAQQVDLYRKDVDAAAPLILLLAGLPFAFATGRKGSLFGIAVALAVTIAYYILGALFHAAGQMQWLDPALAAWAPSVLLGLTGGYFLMNLRT